MTKRQKMEWERDRRQLIGGIRKYTDECLILKTLLHGPLRFSQIKLLLNIKPARLGHLLKELCEMFWIVPRAVPNKVKVKFYELHKGQWILASGGLPEKCKILVVYELTKRGESVLRALVK